MESVSLSSLPGMLRGACGVTSSGVRLSRASSLGDVGIPSAKDDTEALFEEFVAAKAQPASANEMGSGYTLVSASAGSSPRGEGRAAADAGGGGSLPEGALPLAA
jgi:hypothetical protein